MFGSHSTYTALPKDEDADERRGNTNSVRASTWLGATSGRWPAVLVLSLVLHALIFFSIVAYVSRHSQTLASSQPFSQTLYCAFQNSILGGEGACRVERERRGDSMLTSIEIQRRLKTR